MSRIDLADAIKLNWTMKTLHIERVPVGLITSSVRKFAAVSVAVLLISVPVSAQMDVAVLPEPAELKAYSSYSEILSQLRVLESLYPQWLDVVTIGMSHGDDGDVSAPSDNRQILAVKISDRVDLQDDGGSQSEPDVLFIGGQHAREWISIAVPLRLIEYLASSYESNQEVKRLVDSTEIWIVPLVNPDGYEYSRNSDRMWRKNRRDNGDGTFGVDLNRNFPYPLGLRWDAPLPNGSFTSIDPNFETYRGKSPFSEPESRAIRDLVNQQDFELAVSFHNYGQTILYPWGVQATPTQDESLLSSMANTMSKLIIESGGAEYRPTQSYDPMNFSGGAYLKHGEISDWLYDLGILAFTIELRPSTGRDGGFVLPVNEIDDVIREMIPVAEYLLDYSIDSFSQNALFSEDLTDAAMGELIDLNRNGYIDDNELFTLVDYWISGTPIAGSQVMIDNELFFVLLDKWSAGQPIAERAPLTPEPLVISSTAISQNQGFFNLAVEGAGIESIRLRVFNMAGEELLQREGPGSGLDFRLFDEVGYELANGTYLYTVTAFGANGTIQTTQVNKFIVLRQGFRNRMSQPSL